VALSCCLMDCLIVSLFVASALGIPLPASAESASPGNSLYAQGAAQLLQREFQREDLSFLLLDAQTGALLASHWDSLDRPIPLGSLIKPFVALAYSDAHQSRFPTHVCKGETAGCWLPRGHGEIGMVAAIANSCNAYFRLLTATMTSADVLSAATRFGLDPPAAELAGADLIGVGNRWLISPLRMARAYAELNRQRAEPGATEVIEGMAQSARQGTGLEVNRALRRTAALVKTGTAACTHSVHAPGDGFVVALVPAARPQLVLLVRVHGVPGSRASVTAGKMLSRIEE
jgi:cell division protein FtsI/penicillin-binding protein 2